MSNPKPGTGPVFLSSKLPKTAVLDISAEAQTYVPSLRLQPKDLAQVSQLGRAFGPFRFGKRCRGTAAGPRRSPLSRSVRPGSRAVVQCSSSGRRVVNITPRAFFDFTPLDVEQIHLPPNLCQPASSPNCSRRPSQEDLRQKRARRAARRKEARARRSPLRGRVVRTLEVSHFMF